MAHFAKIEKSFVTQVIVIDNDILKDENGQEQESLGIAFCKSLLGEETEWVQTSYNNSFRGQYAGTGMTYDPELDQFITPIIEETP